MRITERETHITFIVGLQKDLHNLIFNKNSIIQIINILISDGTLEFPKQTKHLKSLKKEISKKNPDESKIKKIINSIKATNE